MNRYLSRMIATLAVAQAFFAAGVSAQAPVDGPGEPKYPRAAECIEKFESLARETRADGGRWARIEWQRDDRGFNVLHFMGSSPLPLGFSTWGFIDIEGFDTAGGSEELARYFLEVNVRRPIYFEDAGVVVELNDLQGDGNAIGRAGFFYRPECTCLSPESGCLAGKGLVGFKVFPYETDRRGWQACVFYNKSFDRPLGGRFSVGGFCDLNLDAAASGGSVVVTEHQIRLRVVEGLHLITEFRLNEFLVDDFGIAPALQYRF